MTPFDKRLTPPTLESHNDRRTSRRAKEYSARQMDGMNDNYLLMKKRWTRLNGDAAQDYLSLTWFFIDCP